MIFMTNFRVSGLVLPIENNMKNKKAYPALLTIGMIIICIAMAVLGIIGYLSYGMGVNSLITFNLPAEGPLPLIIKILLMISLLFTYPIQLFPISQMLDTATGKVINKLKAKTKTNQEETSNLFSDRQVTYYDDKDQSSINNVLLSNNNRTSERTYEEFEKKSLFKTFLSLLLSPKFHVENAIRFLMIMLTALLSSFIPSFGDFLGLIGGFGGTTLALVLPCAIHLKVMWKVIGWPERIKDIALMVFGIVATGISTYVSFRDLVNHLEGSN